MLMDSSYPSHMHTRLTTSHNILLHYFTQRVACTHIFCYTLEWFFLYSFFIVNNHFAGENTCIHVYYTGIHLNMYTHIFCTTKCLAVQFSSVPWVQRGTHMFTRDSLISSILFYLHTVSKPITFPFLPSPVHMYIIAVVLPLSSSSIDFILSRRKKVYPFSREPIILSPAW